MGKLLFFKDEREKELELIEKRRERIDRFEPLFRTALEYALIWSKTPYDYGLKERCSGMSFALEFGTINALGLDLYLGPDDSIIKDVSDIIEQLKEHPHYDFIGADEYVEMKWRAWSFRHKTANEILKVRAWFENSNKCELVETGELKPVYKISCQE